MIAETRLRAALAGLPGHRISGYEWDCEECHLAWGRDPCPDCNGGTHDGGEYHDHLGNPCEHWDLIDRRLALDIIDRLTNG